MAIAFVRWLFWAIMLGKEKNLEIKIQHPKCFSFVGFSRVDQGLTPLTPQQNRTCAINAYGSSLNIPISPIEQTHSYLRLS